MRAPNDPSRVFNRRRANPLPQIFGDRCDPHTWSAMSCLHTDRVLRRVRLGRRRCLTTARVRRAVRLALQMPPIRTKLTVDRMDIVRECGCTI